MTVDAAIADRVAIRELADRYAFAVDARDWELYRRIFTPDAKIDYSDSGGPTGDAGSMANWLAEALAPFAGLQHNMTSHLAEVEGDSARACTYFLAYHTTVDGEGEQVLVMGGFYQDKLRRTPAGWRIAERAELGVWMQGPYPDDVPKPPWYGAATHHTPGLPS